jgi:hypothetical protein
VLWTLQQSFFSILGSLSSFFAFILWRDGEDLGVFRGFCLGTFVSIVPACCDLILASDFVSSFARLRWQWWR